MENLQNVELVVTQSVGEITGNFTEIKNQLEKVMAVYKTTQYEAATAAENIKLMKTDRAELAKAQKSLAKKVSEAKKTALTPFEKFKNEANQLNEMIEEQRKFLDTEIKDYEQKGREEKRALIRTFYDSINSEIEEDFREELYTRVYNSSWENVTATAKAYKEGLLKAVKNYLNGKETIHCMESDFTEEGISELRRSLNISEAVNTIQKLEKQKEEMLARERVRIQEEERRKAEAEAKRKAEEEMRIREAEIRAKMEAEKEAESKKIAEEINKMQNMPSSMPIVRAIAAEKNGKVPEKNLKESIDRNSSYNEKTNGQEMVTVCIAKESWSDVKNYLEFNGYTYKKM